MTDIFSLLPNDMQGHMLSVFGHDTTIVKDKNIMYSDPSINC